VVNAELFRSRFMGDSGLLHKLAGCAPAVDEVDVELFTLPTADLTALTKAAVAGRSAKAEAGWRALWVDATDASLAADERLHAGLLPRALEVAMRSLRRAPVTAGGAAVCYAALLATPGAPFHALFTPLAFDAMLRVLRELTHADNATAAAASKGASRKRERERERRSGGYNSYRRSLGFGVGFD
jgi:hypothetical protein